MSNARTAPAYDPFEPLVPGAFPNRVAAKPVRAQGPTPAAISKKALRATRLEINYPRALHDRLKATAVAYNLPFAVLIRAILYAWIEAQVGANHGRERLGAQAILYGREGGAPAQGAGLPAGLAHGRGRA